jgi:hypothetical protein
MKSSDAAALYRRAGFAPPVEVDEPQWEKVSNTRRKAVDGIVFRSTLEANVYQLLKLWRAAGRISDLKVQPLFVLQPKMRRDGKAIRAITYTADFSFTRDGKTVVVDAKGFHMEVYRIKRKMFLALFPDIVFEEWDREKLRVEY